MRNIKILSLITLAVLVFVAACGRSNNEIEPIYINAEETPTEAIEVIEPELPEVEEPATNMPEFGTAIEEPLEPNHIWEIWTLAYVDVDSWKEDITQFRNFVFRVHPKFTNSATSNLSYSEIGVAFDAHIDWLLENVPYLTKFEILVQLQQASALLKDNHFLFGAALPIIQRPDTISFIHQLREDRYPLQFRWFCDGLYLYRSIESEDVIPALNHRLIAINDIPIEDIFVAFQSFWSIENIYDARTSFANHLNSPGILYALGVWDRGSTIYTFFDDTVGSFSVSMTEPFNVPHNLSEFWRLDFPEPLTDNRHYGELPLFLQNAHQAHWYTYIKEYGILYMRINGYPTWRNTEYDIHIKALIGEIGDNITATIIDARDNPGGDMSYYQSLFDALAEATPQGKLFYFMNEGSYSAALLAGGYLYQLGATIVGQPSGQLIDFYAFVGGFAEIHVSLRHTWTSVHVPNSFLTIRDNGVESEDLVFRPHVFIEYTIDDWINNRDPYLQYVLDLYSLMQNAP